MAPPSPEKISEISDRHVRCDGAGCADHCRGCHWRWPCDTRLALDALEEALRALREIRQILGRSRA